MTEDTVYTTVMEKEWYHRIELGRETVCSNTSRTPIWNAVYKKEKPGCPIVSG